MEKACPESFCFDTLDRDSSDRNSFIFDVLLEGDRSRLNSVFFFLFKLPSRTGLPTQSVGRLVQLQVNVPRDLMSAVIDLLRMIEDYIDSSESDTTPQRYRNRFV